MLEKHEGTAVKIGVIGTGLMGAPMTLRLMSSGHRVWIYNRTQSRLKHLELAGAIPCNTPEEVLVQADAVILMVTNAAAIREVLVQGNGAQGSENSALANQTILQMGTIAPAESRILQQEFRQLGASYLEAPVLGSIPEAKNGTLIVMVGADPDQYQRWMPLLKCFGERVYHIGPVGTAASLKLAMNQLIGSLTAAFAQSLGLIQKEGIDTDTFMDVLRPSAVYAPTFDKKLKRMQTRNFTDPNFPAKHLLKDMTLFVETARAAGLDTLAADSVQRVVEQAVQAGFADDDYSALFNIISPLIEDGEV
jgi:3-hydroxyisobutyrate dehydrogenase